MDITGRCHCGKISYCAKATPSYNVLCHCTDCRRWSGAPIVGWIAFKQKEVKISGTPKEYHSSKYAIREFCGDCGTGLFYKNETMLPGIIDVQSGTLDDMSLYPPTAHIMVKDKVKWVKQNDDLPKFETLPTKYQN